MRSAGSDKDVSELATQLQDWRLKAEGLEKEKEFYYAKLRDIELLCQTPVITEVPVGVQHSSHMRVCDSNRSCMSDNHHVMRDVCLSVPVWRTLRVCA